MRPPSSTSQFLRGGRAGWTIFLSKKKFFFSASGYADFFIFFFMFFICFFCLIHFALFLVQDSGTSQQPSPLQKWSVLKKIKITQKYKMKINCRLLQLNTFLPEGRLKQWVRTTICTALLDSGAKFTTVTHRRTAVSIWLTPSGSVEDS